MARWPYFKKLFCNVDPNPPPLALRIGPQRAARASQRSTMRLIAAWIMATAVTVAFGAAPTVCNYGSTHLFMQLPIYKPPRVALPRPDDR